MSVSHNTHIEYVNSDKVGKLLQYFEFDLKSLQQKSHSHANKKKKKQKIISILQFAGFGMKIAKIVLSVSFFFFIVVVVQ